MYILYQSSGEKNGRVVVDNPTPIKPLIIVSNIVHLSKYRNSWGHVVPSPDTKACGHNTCISVEDKCF
jgi:hypothetical protein